MLRRLQGQFLQGKARSFKGSPSGSISKFRPFPRLVGGCPCFQQFTAGPLSLEGDGRMRQPCYFQTESLSARKLFTPMRHFSLNSSSPPPPSAPPQRASSHTRLLVHFAAAVVYLFFTAVGVLFFYLLNSFKGLTYLIWLYDFNQSSFHFFFPSSFCCHVQYVFPLLSVNILQADQDCR